MDSLSKDLKTPTRKKLSQIPLTPVTPTVDDTVKRRVSDILVTLHKYVQTWEVQNQASFNTANTLCNLYSQWNSVNGGKDIPEINEMCKRKYYVKLVATREDLIQQLQKHKVKLNTLIKKMTELVNNLRAIYYLGLTSQSVNNSSISDTHDLNSTNEEVAVFATWDAKRFYQTSRLLLDMYSKEYLLKAALYEQFFKYRVVSSADDDAEDANAEQNNSLTQCVSVWLHQPYIENSSQMLLDSMLVEAGLK